MLKVEVLILGKLRGYVMDELPIEKDFISMCWDKLLVERCVQEIVLSFKGELTN